mmetsp:Transcript_29640/g.40224  ORF Transcript_29640/g.40224 Transcript_29640/m.40224 type:complete len:467 (-) Transcript_29640:446-1846(-)
MLRLSFNSFQPRCIKPITVPQTLTRRNIYKYIRKKKRRVSHHRRSTALDMKTRAKRLGVEMTDNEIALMVRTMPINRGGVLTQSLYMKWLENVTRPGLERRALLRHVGKADETRFEGRMLAWVDVVSTTLYASIGVIYASEAGMNVVGSIFVGCAAGLGGGTVNNIIMGSVPVSWIRDPRWLACVIATSLATFYIWPVVEDTLVKREFQHMLNATLETSDGGAGGGGGGESDAVVSDVSLLVRRITGGGGEEPSDDMLGVSFEGFERWLATQDKVWYKSRRRIFITSLMAEKRGKEDNLMRRVTSEVEDREIFDFLDKGGKGYLTPDDLTVLSRQITYDSEVMYVMDCFCLSSFAITGANQAITLGLHPMVCAVSGVTICFGGIIRDLLCQRNVAVTAQSFALATGAGATVYVGLRQVMLRGGLNLPLWFRITVTSSTVLYLRWLDWNSYPEPLLPPSASMQTEVP